MRVIDTRTGAATDAPSLDGGSGGAFWLAAIAVLGLLAVYAWQSEAAKKGKPNE